MTSRTLRLPSGQHTNTRRFSRTLNEAFPYGAEYGCAIERPARNPYPRVLWWAMLIGAVAAILAAIYT